MAMADAARLTGDERDRVRKALTRLCGGNISDAEDVLQSALMRVIGCENESINLTGHVFIIGKRLASDLKRRKRREIPFNESKRLPLAQVAHRCDRVTTFDTPELRMIHRSDRACLRAALATLGERERRILYARAQGVTLREIGEREGMDLRRVADVLSRVVRRLAKAIGTGDTT